MGDTEAMREALADAILSLRSEANLASRAGQHDRLHAIADSLNAASRAALAALPAPEPAPGDVAVLLSRIQTQGVFSEAEEEAVDVVMDALLAVELADRDRRLTSAAPVPEGMPEDRIAPEGWRWKWCDCTRSEFGTEQHPVWFPDTPHEEGGP